MAEAEDLVKMDSEIGRECLPYTFSPRSMNIEISDREGDIEETEEYLGSCSSKIVMGFDKLLALMEENNHPVRSLKEQSAFKLFELRDESSSLSAESMKVVERKLLENKNATRQIFEGQKIKHSTKIKLCIDEKMKAKQEDLIKLANNTCSTYITDLDLHLGTSYSDIDFNSLRSFPALEAITLRGDDCFVKVHFVGKKYPKLRRLELEQSLQVADFILDLPTLESLNFEHITMRTEASCNFGLSIGLCPRLKNIWGYKCFGLGVSKKRFAHRLVLPSCETFSFRRSDDLNHLIFLYAPKLKEIGLESCYSLESCYLLNRLETSMDWLAKNYPSVLSRIGDSELNKVYSRYIVETYHSGWDPLPTARHFRGDRDEVGNILFNKRCRRVDTKDMLMADEEMYGCGSDNSYNSDEDDDEGAQITCIDFSVEEWNCEECIDDPVVVEKIHELNQDLELYPYDTDSDEEDYDAEYYVSDDEEDYGDEDDNEDVIVEEENWGEEQD